MSQPNPERFVLVVDDDVSLRKVMEIWLRNAGYKVIGTSGRDEILALLQSKQFDLIVTDVLMPDIDGIEVIKAVKTYQPEAAILAVSGGGPRLTAELCLVIARSMGAGVPLMKPFGTNDFLTAVQQALMARNA